MLVGVPTTAPNSGAAMVQNVDLPEYSGNQEGPATGYFQLLGVNPAPTPPQWNYLVRIPDSFMTSRSIDIRITNVSENPIYTSGPSQESYPLMFTLSDSATDVSVTISIVGETGENLVTSDPPGINCRPTALRFVLVDGKVDSQLQSPD
jgi:hypothetical protein